MIKFTFNQIEFLREIGINFDFEKELSDSELNYVNEEVAEKLQKSGFDDDYKVNETGHKCEMILDLLGEDE